MLLKMVAMMMMTFDLPQLYSVDSCLSFYSPEQGFVLFLQKHLHSHDYLVECLPERFQP